MKNLSFSNPRVPGSFDELSIWLVVHRPKCDELCDFLRIIDIGCDLRRIIRNSFIADM